MINREKLKKLSETDIKNIDVSNLVDINTVSIDPKQDAATRVQTFIHQVKNPYCFLVGDTPVKISFSGSEKTLNNALFCYFSSLKM